MRKFLIPVLLASVAATPAVARSNDWSDRQQSQQDKQQSKDNRQQVRQERAQQREERSANHPSFNGEARAEQLQVQPRQDVAQRQFNTGARFQPAFQGGRGSFGAERNFDAAQQQQAYAAQRQAYIQQQQQARAAQRDQRNGGERDWRQNRSWQGNDQARGQFEQRTRSEPGRAINWNRNWQNDERYDWRHYREHHRSRFHLGIYIDPFGWNYQPYSIGYRMYPGYFGNQYWIDPAMYDLPFPPPGTAWVRYWNDAVLVDTYTGTVLDVIPGFFW